ncbi:CLUMA_CG019341, isoform A [Clunio marinus]|uniref:CLUMA_CG019341, isoform A n=1 Tax=Clunio marinus TaxID=568069 RepID=A0A1J1J1S7_9DIPT|nr:CLUMA_CG019341, isoform A [Clunio marinus]
MGLRFLCKKFFSFFVSTIVEGAFSSMWLHKIESNIRKLVFFSINLQFSYRNVHKSHKFSKEEICMVRVALNFVNMLNASDNMLESSFVVVSLTTS